MAVTFEFPMFQHPARVSAFQARLISSLLVGIILLAFMIGGGGLSWFLVFLIAADSLWGAFAGPAKSGLGLAANFIQEKLGKQALVNTGSGGERQFATLLNGVVALLACSARWNQYGNFGGFLVFLIFAGAVADAAAEVCPAVLLFNKLKASGVVGVKVV